MQRGKRDTKRNSSCTVVSGFPLHFMFYRGNLEGFSNRVKWIDCREKTDFEKSRETVPIKALQTYFFSREFKNSIAFKTFLCNKQMCEMKGQNLKRRNFQNIAMKPVSNEWVPNFPNHAKTTANPWSNNMATYNYTLFS